MSKENIKKHSSMRNGLPGIERRQSREELKEQTIEQKLGSTNDQTEVMKKIQNKLRMRKRSSNINANERLVNTPPDLSSTENLSNQQISDSYGTRELHSYDMSIDVPEIIQRIMENDENVIDKLLIAKIDPQIVKDQLIKDSTFILCQLNKGRRVEEVILERVEGIIESSKLKQRIFEKQKNIIAMMDQRIKKLSLLQKSVLH